MAHFLSNNIDKTKKYYECKLGQITSIGCFRYELKLKLKKQQHIFFMFLYRSSRYINLKSYLFLFQ